MKLFNVFLVVVVAVIFSTLFIANQAKIEIETIETFSVSYSKLAHNIVALDSDYAKGLDEEEVINNNDKIATQLNELIIINFGNECASKFKEVYLTDYKVKQGYKLPDSIVVNLICDME